MQWKQYLHQKPLQVAYVVFGLLFLKELIVLISIYGNVSPIADGHSEANAVRGGASFIDLGLAKNSGLPDICHGDLLPKKGGLAKERTGELACPDVYTHYPPGPEYLVWLGMNVVGKNNWPLIRFIPLFLSLFIGLFYIRTVFIVAGEGLKGLALSLMLILPPMFTNYMHGLHYQQYAFILLQLQIALSLLFVRTPKLKYLAMFFVIGFIQGWLSFDYAFLASLFFIPFFIFYSNESSLSFVDMIKVCFASGSGFTLAHVLHFQQVVNYFGSFDAAIEDFRSSAQHRATNAGTKTNAPSEKFVNVGPLTVMKDYLYRVAGRGKYLAVNLINFIWIIVGLRFVKTLETKKYKMRFEVTTRDLMALLSAIIISAMWSLVMKQHAHIHGFIARHYYFCYFFCCLIFIRRTSFLKKD